MLSAGPNISLFLLRKKNLNWYASGGLQVNYLLGYKVEDILALQDNHSSAYYAVTTHIQGTSIVLDHQDHDLGQKPAQLHQIATMSQPILNPYISSSIGNIQVSYPLTKKVALGAVLNLGFTLSDNEKQGTIGVRHRRQYAYDKDKYYFDGPRGLRTF